MNLKGAKVVVTGGSSGIGKAIAKELQAKGAQTLITGRNEEKLQAAAKELGVETLVADVATTEGVQKTFETIERVFAGLDVLINNAGIGYRASLDDTDLEEMEEVWRVNVRGPLHMAQLACRQYFIPQKRGAIVNIASTAALRGYAGGSAYSSSKFALRSLSECWRAELREHDIRVMNICPSEVTTAFGSESREERAERKDRLRATEVAHCVLSALELDDRGFIPELSLFATNPR